ncbi:MAG: hypothetical protein E7301_03235 [Butyrivibrio sp.]|nr:hypothetical protein [Butyrivibrio sp.]
MRTFKKTAGVIAALVLFVLINSVFSFVLRPFSGSGNEMWEGFFASEKTDMVYTGSSQCLCDINPLAVDEKTGLKSYNMGTNMQSIQSSYIALKEAIEKKHICRAVVLIDQDVMEMKRSENFRAEQCFARNLSDNLPFFEGLKSDAAFITDKDFFTKPYSVSYFFPWTYDRISDVRLNINEKMSGQILDEKDHRDERGFYGSDENCEEGSWTVSLDEAKDWSTKSGDLHVLSQNEENMVQLLEIADMCEKNNVTLYVITPPSRSTFAYYDYDGYMAAKENISDNLSKKNIKYYDFNFLKSDYFDTLSEYNYRDDSHMNTEGAGKFSAVLGEFINRLDNGEDVSDMFVI